jgi:regulator of protease activity HflC (stomatin/prohibitin superfamily)
MLKVLAAAIVVGLTVMVWNMALLWLNEPSDLKVWAGYLTIVTIVAGAVKGVRMWIRHNGGMFGVVFILAMTTGCMYKTVPPGHVGIRVEMTGSDRGVQQIPLQTGRIWYNPINETVLDYPTFVQRAIWTRSSVEGSPNNDEISFQSKDALHFAADVAVSYQLLRDKVPHFYVQFRNDNISSFTHGFLRDAVRNAIGKIANEYTAEEINGIKQSEITEKALAAVSKKLEVIGVDIVQMGFTSPPRPPEEVARAIKNKIAAIQRAEQAENERREAIAEGEKTVALAQATARANEVIQRSVTPQLIQWRQLDILNAKWDGKFPQVQGATGNPMLMLQPR